MLKYLSFLSGVVLMSACHRTPARVASTTPISVEVTFKGADDFTLEGTFESPEGKGPFPAMLLIPGSGPTDRDGNTKLSPVKVDFLKTIADELASHGVASVRFDKRAIAIYKDKWPKSLDAMADFFDFPKFIGDAEGAFHFLQGRPEVDPKRVGILGHSEGALIALELSNRASVSSAATILIGCTGRPMGAVIHDQLADQLAKSPGVDPKPYLDYSDAACAALAAGEPLPPNMPQGLGALFNPTTTKIMGAYCRTDPVKLAATMKGPVLVINGGDDTQVSPVKDTPLIMKALKGRSTGTVEELIVPKASHQLKSTEDGNRDAFGGPILAVALQAIDKFMSAVFNPQ